MRRHRHIIFALGIFALAFGLRAGMATLTEFKPLFPDYYYNDAYMYDAAARKVLAAWESGSSKSFLAPGTEGYALWVAALYKATIPTPFIPKLFNCLLGAACVSVWAWTAAVLFGKRAGLGTGLAYAIWPSHIFFTSQNFKEAPGFLFIAIVLAGWIGVLTLSAPRRRKAALAVGTVGMVLSGFLRPHLTAFFLISGVAGGAALAAARGRAAWRTVGALILSALLGGLLYDLSHRALRPFMHATKEKTSTLILPVEAGERPDVEVRPNSARGISEYRQIRMRGSRIWSRVSSNREIETEFFPEARFETWLDIALFLPKASFYELFMPLPGLYPLAGKPGRILAAAENTVVLLLFCVAVAGFLRERRRPGSWVLAAFAVSLVPASALFEFDLGSASRHRLQPLAAILPFAAAWAVRRRLRSR